MNDNYAVDNRPCLHRLYRNYRGTKQMEEPMTKLLAIAVLVMLVGTGDK